MSGIRQGHDEYESEEGGSERVDVFLFSFRAVVRSLTTQKANHDKERRNGTPTMRIIARVRFMFPHRQ
jgi:hypothetical protein